MFHPSKRYELCGALGGTVGVIAATLSGVCETYQPDTFTADENGELEYMLLRIRGDIADLANLAAKLARNTTTISNSN